jgi:flagellar hook-associated protein 3 FlgL
MRITQKTLFGNFMRDVNKNRAEMGRIQSDLSSGRKVRVPSQDPVSFERSRILEENIRKEEQYQRNVSSGLRQARLAQEGLDNNIDRLIDIKQLVTHASTDSVSAAERENMADELAGIRDTIVDSFNMSYGDRYLFAGTNSDQPPYEVNGAGPGGVENNSNDTTPQILAGDAVRLDMTVNGVEIRDTDAGDLFAILEDIETALRDDDVEAISGQLDNLNTGIEHVTTLNSRLGSNINRMEYMFEQYESTNITQQSDVSELVDTNYAEAFSNLQRTQIAFESAMAVHTTMFSNTLLDYL